MVVASQGQSGSKTNQTAILILGALVIVSGVGLVVVLALHFQTGEQWKQGIWLVMRFIFLYIDYYRIV